MLFYLEYTSHEVEKLHELLLYFCDQVTLLNPSQFDRTTLFPDWYSATTNKLLKLEGDLDAFIKNFDTTTKQDIISAFKAANNIEHLFNNKVDANTNTLHIPVALNFPAHADFLTDVFATLYAGQLTGKESTFSKKINNLNLHDHYKQFKAQSTSHNRDFTVCPFCGIETLRMLDSEGRPDYDHLLPKGDNLYVFCSVNMKNLVPIGKHCNDLKNANHLLYSDNTRSNRTLAFYPYSDHKQPDPYTLLNFSLGCSDYPSIQKKGAWSLGIASTDPENVSLVEKIATWNRVFNISNRYIEYISTRVRHFITYVIDLVNPTDTIYSVRTELTRRISQELPLDEKRYIAYNEGLLPRRIFYEWLLNEQVFLNSLVSAKLSPLGNTTLVVDEDSSDYE